MKSTRNFQTDALSYRDLADASIRTLLEYLGNLVDQRSQEAKDDLISKLVTEQVKPGHIERSDAVQIAFLVLVAGNATMVNMINLVTATPSIESPSALTP